MVYTVPSKVNIRNIKDVHAELTAHADSNTAIEIDLDGCEDADLSLIQLVESARRTAAAASKTISLTKPANTIIRTTLERAGFLDTFSSNDTKFWFHKEAL